MHSCFIHPWWLLFFVLSKFWQWNSVISLYIHKSVTQIFLQSCDSSWEFEMQLFAPCREKWQWLLKSGNAPLTNPCENLAYILQSVKPLGCRQWQMLSICVNVTFLSSCKLSAETLIILDCTKKACVEKRLRICLQYC